MDSLPLGLSLTRRELQWFMKQWGLPANGTTQAMQETYDCVRATGCIPDGGSFAPPVGRPPTSAGTAKPAATAAASSSPSSKRPAAATSKVPPKKKSPAKKPQPEKRLKKFRSTCSNATRQRIQRALSQRLYLVRRGDVNNHECEFVVLGSTGNVYTVHIGHLPSCSCPDNAKGHHCKHILFVLLKVMGLDSQSPYIYQAALLTTELDDMFASMAARRVGGVMASAQVQQAYASLETGGEEEAPTSPGGGVKRKSLDGDDSSDCPICFDPMTNLKTLTYCRAMCGTNFHADCIRRWCQQHRKNATCPACRQPWQEAGGGSVAHQEGYTNLGRMQGQSPIRDTSTYSTWYGSPYAKRRRWY